MLQHENVVNLSSHTLTYKELSILSKGLSFIPYNPSSASFASADLDEFLRLRYLYRNINRTENPFKLKSNYIPTNSTYKPLEELIHMIHLYLSQIQSTIGWHNLPENGWNPIKQLQEKHDIIINQADKGSCIVVLDRKEYLEAGYKHLDDMQTYVRLETDITDLIKKTIRIKLDKLLEQGYLTKHI